MRRRWITLLSIVMVCAGLAHAAPDLQTDYRGTFSDVTFPKGQRVVKTLRIEVLTPIRGGAHQPRPGLTGLVRIIDANTRLDYEIRNAYVTSSVRLYLATKGASSLTLMIPTSGNATLLFSDRPSAREVKGATPSGAPPR